MTHESAPRYGEEYVMLLFFKTGGNSMNNRIPDKNFAHYLDLADHQPIATHKNIETLCANVLKYGFNSAFVNPYYITYARHNLKKEAKVGTVISFPLGQETLEHKISAAQESAKLGADELDVSLNVAFIKEGLWEKSLEEMKKIVQAAHAVNDNIIVKFIPETGYLTPSEIKQVAHLMVEAGADFFKTCSGLGPRGAHIEDVKLVREAVGNNIKIKVAGGISNYEQARQFIEAGADRIGTSKAVAIINEFLGKK